MTDGRADPARRCAARNQAGNPCRAPAILGGTVCRYHGGAAPQVKAAAERRVQRARAEAALSRLGEPIAVDPHSALLGLVHEAAGNVAFLRTLVQDLTPDVDGGELDGLDLGRGIAGRVDPANFKAEPHVLVSMYGEWCDRLARYAREAISAGCEQARVDAVTQHGEQLAGVLRSFLAAPELELSEGQRVAARGVLARLLRAAPLVIEVSATSGGR